MKLILQFDVLVEVFLVPIRLATVRTDTRLLLNCIRILGTLQGMGILGPNMCKSLPTEFTIVLHTSVVC